MADGKPYLRRAELLVWPTTAATGEAMEFISDGSRQTLYMRFNAVRAFRPLCVSEVVLKNLKPDTRQALRTPLQRVRLRVGWGDKLATILDGMLTSAVTYRQGSDFLTTLRCISGIDATTSATSGVFYPPGTSVATIVTALAKSFGPTVTVDAKQINVRGQVNSGGLTFAGSTKDLLDKLANNYHFTWKIDNGVFAAQDDAQPHGDKVRISSADGNLVSALPILQSALQQQLGVEIVSVLMPGVGPGDTITLDSEITPNLNGDHFCYEVAYSGSPNENEWLMRAKCLIPPKG
jgi:hypothetical protein